MWAFATSTTQPTSVQAGTQTATSGTVVFSNSNNVTFGMSNSSIVTASVSFSGPVLNLYQWAGGAPFINLATLHQTLRVGPIGVIPGVMTVSTVMLQFNGTASQSTASGSFNVYLGLYTLNASTLSLLNSVSTQLTWAAVSNNSTAFSGLRWLTIHSSQWSVQPVLTQTNYWVAVLYSSSNATQGLAEHLMAFASNVGSTAHLGTFGVSNGSLATFLDYPFLGRVVTAALPTSILSGGLTITSAGPFVLFNAAMPTF